MKILNQQIFENKEAAALPGLMESGGLPALVSGLSGIHRVNLAAALYENLELPIFVVCPDDSAAESFSSSGPRSRSLCLYSSYSIKAMCSLHFLKFH